MTTRLVQSIGWYGVLAILFAYTLSSLGWLSNQGVVYTLLNLTGSVAVAIEAASKRDRQPVVLNVIWGLIALLSLVRLLWT